MFVNAFSSSLIQELLFVIFYTSVSFVCVEFAYFLKYKICLFQVLGHSVVVKFVEKNLLEVVHSTSSQTVLAIIFLLI